MTFSVPFKSSNAFLTVSPKSSNTFRNESTSETMSLIWEFAEVISPLKDLVNLSKLAKPSPPKRFISLFSSFMRFIASSYC